MVGGVEFQPTPGRGTLCWAMWVKCSIKSTTCMNSSILPQWWVCPRYVRHSIWVRYYHPFVSTHIRLGHLVSGECQLPEYHAGDSDASQQGRKAVSLSGGTEERERYLHRRTEGRCTSHEQLQVLCDGSCDAQYQAWQCDMTCDAHYHTIDVLSLLLQRSFAVLERSLPRQR